VTLAPNVVDNLKKKKNVSTAFEISNASIKPSAIRVSSKEVSINSSKGLVRFAEPTIENIEDSLKPKLKPSNSRCSSRQNVISFMKNS